VTPSLTLDATINTDFAQVEVDEQQVNLDRFNLFFPEKRPFFLENAGLFAVGSPGEAEVFFSRRIGIASTGEPIPILGGARLSGRTGPVSIGLLNMQTDDEDGITPANNFTVARVQRELGGRSNLGAIYVGRHTTGSGFQLLPGQPPVPDSNHAFAADGRWGIGQRMLISGFVARTATPGVSTSQHAYQVRGQHDTQPLTLTAAYTETGRNFNPEVGFLSRRNGFRKIEGSAFSRLRPKSWTKFQEIRPHTIYRGFFHHDGFQETGFWHNDAHWELRNSWEFHTGVNITREGVVRPFEIYPGILVPAGTYDHAEAQLVLQSNQGAPVYGRFQFVKGGFFGGKRVAFRPELRLRIGDVFSTEFSLDRNDIDLGAGSFVTNLARTRVSYSFSPRVFVQSLVQYNDRTERWSTNLRFHWLETAGTGLFVVYNDTESLNGMGPVNRAFIVKYVRQFDLLN
jgi:hypothetical protein